MDDEGKRWSGKATEIQSGEKIFFFKGKERSYHVRRQKKISGKNEEREENESQERETAKKWKLEKIKSGMNKEKEVLRVKNEEKK